MRSRTWDTVAGVRRPIAEWFRIERSAKRRAYQASEAAADRKFHLWPASLWTLPSAVFRRDPGNRVAGTSYPTQRPPLEDIVSRADNPNKCIGTERSYRTEDGVQHRTRRIPGRAA